MRPPMKRVIATGVASLVLLSALAIMMVAAEYDENLAAFTKSIIIDGDEALAASKIVTRGIGMPDDPFVITGREFIVDDGGGLAISNTTAHLIIEDSIFAGDLRLGTYGIHIKNCSNIRILDSYFAGWIAGILMGEYDGNGCDGIDIRGCSFVSCEFGIAAHWSDDVAIHRNEFTANSDHSCYLSECNSVDIGENTLFAKNHWDRRPTGFHLSNVTDGVVYENRVMFDHSNAIILEYCEGIIVCDNNMSYNCDKDLQVSDSSDIALARNIVGDVGDYYGYYSRGIDLIDSSYCTVMDNVVSTGNIRLINTSVSVIERNGVYDSSGFYFIDLRDSTVSSNRAVNNTEGHWSSKGMFFTSATNVTIIDNFVSRNGAGGMKIHDSDDVRVVSNIIVDNRVTSFSISGQLYITGCRNSEVTGNFISAEQDVPGYICSNSTNINASLNRFDDADVYLQVLDEMKFVDNRLEGACELDMSSVDGGEMHGNNLLEAYVASAAYTALIMDAGYPTGGNYWQNYIGTDIFSGPDQDLPGPDGIGDEPLILSDEAIDRYPLMNPAEWDDIERQPETHHILAGVRGCAGWFVSNVTVSLTSCSLLEGELATVYRVDSGEWQAYEDEIIIVGTGVHTLEYYSSSIKHDAEEPKIIEIKIDLEGPIFQDIPESIMEFKSNPVDLGLDISDAGSGLSLIYAYSYTGSNFEMTGYRIVNLTLSEGVEYTIHLSALDRAGNYASQDILVTVSAKDTISLIMEEFKPYGMGFIACALSSAILGVSAIALLYIDRRDRPWLAITDGKEATSNVEDSGEERDI